MYHASILERNLSTRGYVLVLLIHLFQKHVKQTIRTSHEDLWCIVLRHTSIVKHQNAVGTCCMCANMCA